LSAERRTRAAADRGYRRQGHVTRPLRQGNTCQYYASYL
jgi:hypothetical protein